MSIKKTLLILFLSLFFVCGQSSAAQAADSGTKTGLQNFETNLDKVAGSGAGYKTGKDVSLEKTIGSMITTALSLLGVIFMILMIYGGFLWMTAAGNDENVTKAQKLITAAVIGLIVVLAAFGISYFIINGLSQSTLNSTTP